MRQPAFIVATLTGSLLFGVSVAGALRAPSNGPATLATPVVQAPRTARDEAQPRAAALAAAIQDQFPGHAVDVALDSTLMADAGGTQAELETLAQVRIDGSAPMPVRAVALYDRQARSIATPSLWFEATGTRAVGVRLRRELAAAAAHKLGEEFAGQPLRLALDDAEAARVGGRYLRLVARGTTDFGAEGRADTAIEALYDPRNGEWLKLDYTLGAEPAPAGDGLAIAGS